MTLTKKWLYTLIALVTLTITLVFQLSPALGATLAMNAGEIRNPSAKTVSLQSGTGPVSVIWSGKTCTLNSSLRSCSYYYEPVKITNKGSSSVILNIS
jgi:hypothetical protein